MHVNFDIENIGKGPGFILGYGIAHEICVAEKQGSVPLTTRDGFARMVVSADAKFRAGAAYDVFQISDDDREAMLKFRKTLYVYGHIRYLDLFGVTRTTGFMFEYIPSREAPDDSVFAMCPAPNWWFDREEGLSDTRTA